MGLNLRRPDSAITPSSEPTNQIEVYEQYDIAADRQQMNQTLVNSPEVDKLASQIEVYNLETIVSFGAEAAEEI